MLKTCRTFIRTPSSLVSSCRKERIGSQESRVRLGRLLFELWLWLLLLNSSSSTNPSRSSSWLVVAPLVVSWTLDDVEAFIKRCLLLLSVDCSCCDLRFGSSSSSSSLLFRFRFCASDSVDVVVVVVTGWFSCCGDGRFEFELDRRLEP